MHSTATNPSLHEDFAMKSKRKGSVLDDLGIPLTIMNLHVI